MTVAFRADASVDIGTGHVMRCLSLADALREAGETCAFVYREHRGHLGNVIADRGHVALPLPYAPETQGVPKADALSHAAWLGVPQEVDAAQTADAFSVAGMDPPRYIVVDHYALDWRWRAAVGWPDARTLAIDDLADRHHWCDLLVDQNLGRTPAHYTGRVPRGTPCLTGPRFALLRPDFAAAELKAGGGRSSGIGPLRILVTMGGVDTSNVTAKVLAALCEVKRLRSCEIEVEVILGATAPHLSTIRALAAKVPFPVEISVNVTKMASRMTAADLAISAAGSTTWELCAVGIPSLLATVADNQAGAAETMEAYGAAIAIGWSSDPGFARRIQEGVERLTDRAVRADMANRAAHICDGGGTRRVVEALISSKDLV